MSGVTITISGGEALTKQLNKLAKAMVKMKPAFDDIGNSMVSRVTGLFADAVDPYDVKWAEIETATKRGRLRRNKRNYNKNGRLSAQGRREAAAGFQPLNDTGRLRNSITYQADHKLVVFGSGDDLVYAATHQFGDASRNIPARPFLPTEGLPNDWQVSIEDTIVQHLTMALEK